MAPDEQMMQRFEAAVVAGGGNCPARNTFTLRGDASEESEYLNQRDQDRYEGFKLAMGLMQDSRQLEAAIQLGGFYVASGLAVLNMHYSGWAENIQGNERFMQLAKTLAVQTGLLPGESNG